MKYWAKFNGDDVDILGVKKYVYRHGLYHIETSQGSFSIPKEDLKSSRQEAYERLREWVEVGYEEQINNKIMVVSNLKKKLTKANSDLKRIRGNQERYRRILNGSPNE